MFFKFNGPPWEVVKHFKSPIQWELSLQIFFPLNTDWPIKNWQKIVMSKGHSGGFACFLES
jgi:hypothetical protein